MMNPTIEWQEIKNQRFLFMCFVGNLSVEDTQRAVSTIPSMIIGNENKVAMVWECTRMTGYDPAARDAWQRFIKDIRPRLKAVHLVSNKLLIRTGAMVVGVFAGIKVTTWADLDEFQAQC